MIDAARSSSGRGCRFFKPETGVRVSYGLLNAKRLKTKRDEGGVVPRVLWEHEPVGSSPTFPTAVKELLSGVVTAA
jgi:hypothetical protein